MATNIDLKKDLKHLYKPSAKTVTFVDVPPMNYLMIDGKGNPNTAPAYEAAIQGLYKLAYTIRFAIKKRQGISYTVMPLEGLWWVPDMTQFSVDAKEDWLWTMLLLQPEFVTAELVAEQQEALQEKADTPPAVVDIRFETYTEGKAVQILHIGPYADEGPTVSRLHTAIHDGGFAIAGKHHEIYLNDPRRTAPEKLKTIIRQPMREQ